MSNKQQEKKYWYCCFCVLTYITCVCVCKKKKIDTDSGMVKKNIKIIAQTLWLLKKHDISPQKFKKTLVEKWFKTYQLTMTGKNQKYEQENMVKLVQQHKNIHIKKWSKVALSTKNTTAKSRKTWSHFDRKIFGDTEHFVSSDSSMVKQSTKQNFIKIIDK